ncbi:MAG TPA: MgtC/SapB family protein [Fimbriimonadaceae bacterium]|nr:MgtC/SapB family protein [Fimbriimonadaceae bacterium]
MKELWGVNGVGYEHIGMVLNKLAVGAVLAGMIGWEREKGGRAAGIRTHMLIVFGVILFCEAGKVFPGTEPNRIASMIVTGIGFLGAGSIFRSGSEIKGLTTAASMWTVAGIGMAVSVGGPFMIVAAVSTLLVLAVLALVKRIEARYIPEGHPCELLLSVREGTEISAVLAVLSQAGMRIARTQLNDAGSTIELAVQGAGDRDTILRAASAFRGVISACWND